MEIVKDKDYTLGNNCKMISTVYRNFVPLHIQTLLLQIISEYFYIENRLKTLC